MTRLLILVTGLALAPLMTQPAFAVTYRWVDANGIVNYSERKPRNVPEDRVTAIEDTKQRRSESTTAPIPTANTQATPAAPLSEQQEARLRELQTAEVNRQREVAEIRQGNCERSQRVLDNLTVRNQVRFIDKDGQAKVMPEEERQERIAQAQRDIVENCQS